MPYHTTLAKVKLNMWIHPVIQSHSKLWQVVLITSSIFMVIRSVTLLPDKHWKHNLLNNKAFNAAFLSPSILCLQHISWSKDGSLTFRFKMKGNWFKKKQWISYCLLYAGTCRTEICQVMQFLFAVINSKYFESHCAMILTYSFRIENMCYCFERMIWYRVRFAILWYI